MFLFGYSIDNISLLAITLAVGFVVDDAIVMLENIVRHIEEGQPPFEAALTGAREIGFTILSITLSLVAVFIPVLLMGGVVGRVFREFAVTISCAILVSGFVSLTLTPMLCARMLHPIDHHAKQNFFYRLIDFGINGITSAYRSTLDLVLRWRLVMLGITFVTFYLSVSLFISIPKGFFPIEDTGFISGATEIAAGTGFPLFAQRQQEIAAILMKDPAVEYVTTSVVFVGSGGANQGSVLVALKPKGERDSMDAMITRLRRLTVAVPGINVVYQAVQNLNLNGGRASRAPYQYTLQATDLNSLYTKAPEMLAKLQQLPMLRDVNSDLQIRNPTISIDIDHDKAAAFGLTTDQIRNRALQFLWHASDFDDFHPSGGLRGHSRNQPCHARRPFSARPRGYPGADGFGRNSGFVDLYVGDIDRLERTDRSARRGGYPASCDRIADRQSAVAAAVGDLVVQRGTGLFNRRSR